MTIYEAEGAGFFDLRNHIVVVPEARVPVHLVVEHEMTHVNIVRTAALGVLEEALAALYGWAFHLNDSDGMARIRSARASLSRWSHPVHEAAAWFATEELRRDYEGKELRLRPPLSYQPDVARLIRLFTPLELSALARIELVEAIAARALSAPQIVDLLALPDRLTIDPAEDALSTDPPIRRFRNLTQWVISKGWSADLLQEWARWNAAWNGEAVAWTPMSTLGREAPSRILPAIARELDIDVFRSPWEGAAAGAEAVWHFYDDHWRIDLSTDRYLHVCVLHTHGVVNPPTPFHGELRELNQSLLLSVQGTSSRPGQPEGGRVFDADHVAVLALPPWASTSTWRALSLHDLRNLLRDDPTALVIASSEGYDMNKGDYPGGFLRGVAHVVIATLSFAGLLNRLTRGLAGSNKLEFIVAPSFVYQEYGYVLIKPSKVESPVVISPTPLQLWNRVDPRVWTPAGRGRGFRLGNVRLQPATKIIPRWASAAYVRIVAAMALIEGWATQLRGVPPETLLELRNPDAAGLAPDEVEQILSYVMSVIPLPNEGSNP
jgi:hypothetical protein